MWSSPSIKTQKKAHPTTRRSLQWLNSSRNKKWLSRIKRFGSVRFRLELGSVRLERCHTSLGQVSQTSNFQVCFAFCFLFFAFCFLPFAFCLLPFAFCFFAFVKEKKNRAVAVCRRSRGERERDRETMLRTAIAHTCSLPLLLPALPSSFVARLFFKSTNRTRISSPSPSSSSSTSRRNLASSSTIAMASSISSRSPPSLPLPPLSFDGKVIVLLCSPKSVSE